MVASAAATTSTAAANGGNKSAAAGKDDDAGAQGNKKQQHSQQQATLLLWDGTRLLLATYGLYAVAVRAYNIRLFAIEEYGPVIHEFDPWFNYRATEVT